LALFIIVVDGAAIGNFHLVVCSGESQFETDVQKASGFAGFLYLVALID
jgi:hypothetical protein